MRSSLFAALPLAAALPLTLVTGAGAAAATSAPSPTTVAAAADPTADRVPAAVPAAPPVELPGDCPGGNPPDDPQVYYCGYPELGPAALPQQGPVAAMLTGYHRFGGLEPTQFLDWYREGTRWKYPDNRGFTETNGTVDMHRTTLETGRLLDRFGADTGKFLAPGGTPYAKRALPPDSLNGPANDYHCYTVSRTFQVQDGTTAAAFAQPGFGRQQWLDPALKPADFAEAETFNVANLVKHEYLTTTAPEQCAAARAAASTS
ncbi:TNT domain-containing protein [Kitasatospora sp. NPDC054939]